MPKFGAQIDTMRIPIKGLIPEQSASALGTPVEGLMWHDTANKQVKVYLNGAWVQMDNVAGGTASNVTDGDKGVITVTGGVWNLDPNTVANTNIQTDAITTLKIQDGAVTSVKLANADFGDFTVAAGVATIDTGAVTSAKIADGTIQVSDTQTAFDLGALALAHPTTTNVSLNNKTIVSLGDPVNPTDAANKYYVDSVAAGLDPKQSVAAATTGNVSLSGTGTYDGVALSSGARLLVKNQTTASENGIYIVGAGAWSRAADLDSGIEFPGAFVFVEQGTTQADTGWVCTSDPPVAVGTTAITWAQFSGAGSVNAGAGLTRTGNTIDVGNTTTSGLSVNADDIAIKLSTNSGMQLSTNGLSLSVDQSLNLSAGGVQVKLAPSGGLASTASGLTVDGTVVARKFVRADAAPTVGSYVTVNHGLNSSTVTVQFDEQGGQGPIFLDWNIVDANNIRYKADAALNAAGVRVMVFA